MMYTECDPIIFVFQTCSVNEWNLYWGAWYRLGQTSSAYGRVWFGRIASDANIEKFSGSKGNYESWENYLKLIIPVYQLLKYLSVQRTVPTRNSWTALMVSRISALFLLCEFVLACVDRLELS